MAKGNRKRGAAAAGTRPTARTNTARRTAPSPKRKGRVVGAGAWRTQHLRGQAQNRLRRFRQGSLLAVAITALLLVAFGGVEQQDTALDETAVAQTTEDAVPDAGRALEEATGSLHDMVLAFWAFLPKLALAAGLFVLAWLVARALRLVSSRAVGRWQRAEAVRVLLQMACYLVAAAAALGVLAGDARALLGSLGLVGLALSWALQTPIESFTGWLLNSFRSYYRVGDRIEVGDVFGDVYRIDVLTTTVWEAGGPGKAVQAAQSTGALVTFPNWEVLRSNVVNYSRDFPYVWDEVTFALDDGSDLGYAIDVLERAAAECLGESMAEAVAKYRGLLERARLAFDVDEAPRAFLAMQDGWVDCTVRYLVDARARRRWATRLIVTLSRELARPEHAGRIAGGYPRTDVRMLAPRAVDAGFNRSR